MPYRFLADASIADIAFVVKEKNLDRFFEQAAEATFACMADLKTVRARVSEIVRVQADNLDHLLYDFLSELIFLKDTKGLLFKTFTIRIQEPRTQNPKPETYSLTATARGEKINPKTQKLRNDVKAVTMHNFGIRKTKAGYEAQVTVDI